MHKPWTLCLDAAFWGVRAAGVVDQSVLWNSEKLAGKVANSFFSEITQNFEAFGRPQSVLVNIGPGSFTGIKLSLAFARGLQCGSTGFEGSGKAAELKIYGYGLKELWAYCFENSYKDKIGGCDKPWGLPITAKKMLVCENGELSSKTPAEGLLKSCTVLPSVSPEAVAATYQTKSSKVVSPEDWSSVLLDFWGAASQNNFKSMIENPGPDYFFGSSAEENKGVRVT